MNHDETYDLTADRELDDVIAAYLKAVETGAAPNPESLIAGHPAFAKALLSGCCCSLAGPMVYGPRSVNEAGRSSYCRPELHACLRHRSGM